jgi:hypothetical protein
VKEGCALQGEAGGRSTQRRGKALELMVRQGCIAAGGGRELSRVHACLLEIAVHYIQRLDCL